jgi:hypothetical protein
MVETRFSEKRRFKRKTVNIEVDIVVSDKYVKGFIENISEEGLYVLTAPTKEDVSFAPGTECILNFSTPSGEKILLNCRIIWSYKTPPHGLTYSLGIEIERRPKEYKKFLDTLS